MTVRGKLVSALGIILLLLIATGGVGIWNTMRFSQMTAEMGADTWGVARLANAERALWELRFGPSRFMELTDKAARDRIVANDAKWHKVIDDNLAAYRKGGVSTGELAMLAKFGAVLKQYMGARPRAFELIGEGKLDEAIEYRAKNLRGLGASAVETLTELIELQQKSVAAREKAANELTAVFRTVLVVLVMLAIALVLLVFWFTIRAISVPLAKALALANQVAAGDLTAQIEVTSDDEFGKLLGALKTMNGNLTRMVHDIRGGTESIRNAADEVATGNANLSQRTEEQASTLEETAASMEELTSAVRENTQSAGNVNALVKEANQVAAQGGKAVGMVVATMNEIQESSKKISDIIGVIDSIAFQTNILALNAAVEAARAGEQGRGFAVVATEVRALAQRSADAAKEIKVLIGNSVEKVSAGTTQVENAGKTMSQIVASVEKVTIIIDQITSASREQAGGIEQVNQAVSQMDQVVQQNAALVEEAAAAAESMQGNAQELYQLVSMFKLNGVAPMQPVAPKRAPVKASSKISPSLRALGDHALSPALALSAAGNSADGDWKSF